MNERIRLLAEQAKKYALDDMIKITDREQALKVYSETYDTKFAELIVRECAGRVDNILRERTDGGGTMGNEIREHFGVEE